MKENVRSFLPDNHPWAEHIHWFADIESTNTQAKCMAQQGAPQGTILLADRQTGGLGRMGRSFCSPAGMGIYLSVILRPECPATKLMHLTCAIAVAICDAVEAVTGFRPEVKWINDLLAGNKKLGGILTELVLVPGTAKVDFAVVGIGINCSERTEDFPKNLQNTAVSLQTITQHPVDRSQLVAAILCALERMNASLLSQKAAIMRQYKKDCITLGQDVFLLQGNKKSPCRALDLTLDGALVVQYPDGTIGKIQSGEISIRPQ